PPCGESWPVLVPRSLTRLDEFPRLEGYVGVLLGQRPPVGHEVLQVGVAEGDALRLQRLLQGQGEVGFGHGCLHSSRSRASLISADQAVKKSDPQFRAEGKTPWPAGNGAGRVAPGGYSCGCQGFLFPLQAQHSMASGGCRGRSRPSNHLSGFLFTSTAFRQREKGMSML